jgi:hypothetical protein
MVITTHITRWLIYIIIPMKLPTKNKYLNNINHEIKLIINVTM